ncbi:hypothetical protein K458DRAFT_485719 [Lentithecium fluviatile CBS 122367]|uniref:VWFA domain-containing protein n=1 Tax=Lentithecium fluviatile CBS 122367 TaxID=1168545 RepID=A0A6G1JAM7_9PLEO|nr:hypothetical protein K458DRAFT_485719 [Lentithecium fluviatile CBS 122367]
MWSFPKAHSSPCLVTLLVSCLLPTTGAFFPSDFREKWFGNGGVSHEFQTREAYNTLAATYFPDITPVTANMIKARTTWAEANMEVDDDQTSSAKHFDGENFAGGNAILVQAKINVTNALRNGDGEAARKYLGAALHTVQDFYAHTNWVELKRSDIHFDLGKTGATLSTVTFEDRTCNECGFGGIERVLFGCHDCTSNTNGFTKLTSGYYFGEDSPPADVAIPDHKCHHGGATDSRIGAKTGIVLSDVFRDVTPGINKDSNNCFWSPHHFHHPRAVAFAIKASIQYIEDLVKENSLTEKEKKILFGVGTTLAFAIDTTGSMAGIIVATRSQAIDIAQQRLGTKDEPIDYVVSPFNDPFTGPVFKTTNFTDFQTNINSLSAFGGGDCPELALTGILAALDVMEGPAELFVMTDAAAKDFDLAPQAIAIAVDKRISFHVFKFDSFCDDGIAAKRDSLSRRVDSASNRVYSLLAASTGGTYHSLPTSEAGTISSLLDSLTLSESNAVLKVSGALNDTSSFNLPVDSKMTEFSISLRGAGVTLSLKKPDGSALDTTSSDVTLTTVSDGEFLTVKSPVSGMWTLILIISSASTPTTVSCDVTGVSPLHLSSFNFVTLRGRPGHRGYYPIAGQPAYDHDVAAVAVIDGAFESAVFDLRDSLDVHAIDPHMEPGTGAEGAPPKNSFYGEMRLVPGNLYAYAEGTDDTGAPFQRVLATVFQPFLSNITDTGFNSTDIFAGRNTTNVTISSSSVAPSSTPISFNLSSTSTSSLTSTHIANTSLVPYPTHSASGSGYNHSYPMPTYPWDHATYCPTSTGSITTHSKYMTPGCDSLTPSIYTTTSICTVSDEKPTPYTTVSTMTVTRYVPVLCSSCTGGNYPHHTGKGPWAEEDKSVIKSGYGTCVSTVGLTPYETATGYGSTYTKLSTASEGHTQYAAGSSAPTTPSGSMYGSHASSSATCTESEATSTKQGGYASAVTGATSHSASVAAAPSQDSSAAENSSAAPSVHHVGSEHASYASPSASLSASAYNAPVAPSSYAPPSASRSRAIGHPASIPASLGPAHVPTSSPAIPVFQLSNGTMTATGANEIATANSTGYMPAQFTGTAARVGAAVEGVVIMAAFWAVGLL